MSKILIMDTSSEYLIVSMLSDNEIIFEYIETGKNNHSDNLLKEIEIGLKQNNLEVKDFDKIICGVGPGAYTGLRVSLTVAKMFAWTLKKDLYIVSSLDLMASGLIGSGKVASIDMRAKKDYVYHKIIKTNKDSYTTLDSEAFLSVEEANVNNQKFNIDEFINNSNINYDAKNIEKIAHKCDSIELLEPNYLREGM